jgi:3-deoxy-D-manno-octulosonic-acid transferase
MPKSQLMNIFTYQILSLLLLPFAFFRLVLRAIKQPQYMKYLGERLGFYPKYLKNILKNKKIVWIHCVSVGETNAALPLIKILLERYPNHHILVSHSTPTGRETNLGECKRIHRCYLPFDIKICMNSFLDFFQPSVGLIFETEIWPIMLYQCKSKGVPLLLMNARLSSKSLGRYLLFRNFTSNILSRFEMICAQSEADRKNFKKLTNTNIAVTGNTKFDFPISQKKISRLKVLRKELNISNQILLVAGSTRKGEEKVILDCFKNLKIKNLILILVPRHPQRFKEVENMIASSNFAFAKRSNLKKANQPPAVILGDSMGELQSYYELADLVILGGSIKNFGAQNPIEPLSLGKPTIIGPSIYNFQDVIQKAENHNLIHRLYNVKDLDLLIKKIIALKQKAINRQNLKDFLKKESGASQRLVDIVNQFL